MKAFIRFETARRCAQFKRRVGVFRTAGELEDRADLPHATAKWLRETLDWFNRNLIVPRCDRVDRRGVFWFRSDADEVVERMWDLVAILREQGVPVDIRQTTRPGRIIYHDDQQIAAIPERR